MNQSSMSQTNGFAQDDRWEKALEGIAKRRDSNEITIDPFLIEQLCQDRAGRNYINTILDGNSENEIQYQIDLVQKIARKKLRGLPRYCILLILIHGAGPKRISSLLGVTEKTVRQAVTRGIHTIRECLDEKTKGQFPASQGKRPPFRASIFPLDTPGERREFQKFLNRNTIVHIAYRGEDLFREVLVVYLTGKLARK